MSGPLLYNSFETTTSTKEMTMTATARSIDGNGINNALCIAFELGEGQWKLTLGAGFEGRVVRRTVAARDTQAILRTIEQVKPRLGLEVGGRVFSCYEAGRDGFWLHGFLLAHGIDNVVVDSASIEVNRRRKRAKTDRLDGEALLDLLQRHLRGGRRKVWSVVRVPTREEEDARHLHRELLTAKRDRTRVTNRIRGLLANQGLTLGGLRDLPSQLRAQRLWDGQPLPEALHERLEREWAQVEQLTERIRAIETERRARWKAGQDRATEAARRLYALRGIGANGAWLYAMELFGWREFRNGKEVGSFAGLTPTPYTSGEREREQGIGKDGNRRVRAMAVELAWAWLRFQPQSALARWYERRFGGGSKRLRKIGIVALARKLLVAVWRYLETGTLPEGAELKPDMRLH
jgi:transposase